ncbi:MAG TPA: hypothetical protein VNH11_10075 [Pirellulales bacterium]|nr:hypothetical protein [Pirellulales bacterium]
MASVAEDDLRADFVRELSNHVVAFVANTVLLEDDGSIKAEGFAWSSGFLIRIHAQNFWVTAGHCIRDFERDCLNKPNVTAYGKGFMDCFGSNASFKEVLPCPYDAGDAIMVYRKNPHLDFALLPLSDLICSGLARNGIRVVTREMWLDRPERRYFEYKVIGFPKHGAEKMTQKPSWGLRPAAIGVHRISAADVPGCPHDDSWFIGRVRSGADEFKSVEGMSGGPVFAFYKDQNGGTRYDIIAVQSSWFQDSRVVFACPLGLFAEMLHRAVEESKGNQQ